MKRKKCFIDDPPTTIEYISFPDVLLHILRFLDFKDIISCMQVSTAWFDVGHHPSLWEHLLKSRWPSIPSSTKRENPKSIYRSRVLTERRMKCGTYDIAARLEPAHCIITKMKWAPLND